MSGVSLFTRALNMRVAVLFNTDFQNGPESDEEDTEPPIFWKANAEIAEVADAVAESLVVAGYTPIVMGIDHSVDDLLTRLADARADAVFNLVESLGGDTHREPEVPLCLRDAGIPYTGCGPEILSVAHAKDATRELLRAARVPVPRGIAVNTVANLREVASESLEFPMFVKPARADGSIGISQAAVVYSMHELVERVRDLETVMSGPFVVEEYLPGREFNVAIFPEPFGHRVATEIDFTGYPKDYAPIVTYDCKWEEGSPEYTAFSVPAVDRVSPLLYAQILDVAGRAFVALHGDAYGRVDLRLDANGTPRVIDVNPNSDIHPDAGLLIAARTVGVDHAALVSQIMTSALRRERLNAHQQRLRQRSRADRRTALSDRQLQRGRD